MKSEAVDIAIVGAGQAGLSLSHELRHAGVDHVILERAEVGQSWRGRWDSFHIVSPNWSVQLPGGGYRGDDPEGFMPKSEIIAHLEQYAKSFAAPVIANVNVSSLESTDRGAFLMRTSIGDIVAREVVLATGAYQKPHRPAVAHELPTSLYTIDAEGYTNAGALPPGAVLIVGSGQTGCQFAEELREAGRETYLACGRAPWAPRRIEGRDIVSWIIETQFVDMTLAELPSPAARLIANVQNSGGRGGHDLDYRTLQALGVHLLGHFSGCVDGVAYFAPDLADSVAFGDARYQDLCAFFEKSCNTRGVKPPDMPKPLTFVEPSVERLCLNGFGAVIFTCGFRPDYTSWVKMPPAFDEYGFPIQNDGSSIIIPGLHFMGVHFQRKRKSATLYGVAEDAAVLAEKIAGKTLSEAVI